MRLTTSNTRISGILVFLAASGLVLAQQSAQTGGWRRATDPAPAAQQTQPPDAQQQPQQQDPSEPVARSDDFGQANANAPQAGQQQAKRPAYGLPPQVTLRPGTYVTIRTNQMLSSDHNQVGDAFSGSLLQPLVADGVVVAQRGQTVYGRVAVAEKAHGGKDSRLGLELTSITLADGTQQPVQSQLIAQQGPKTPRGVEAGTVVGTTGVGAVVGGIAGGGAGAGIGAGVGAAAGIIGVLLTHNHETRLYPESALTFNVTSPITVSTLNAPQAFRFVGPEDYNRPQMQYATRPAPSAAVAPGYGYPYPGYYPYYGYGYGYPYWGPSVFIGGGWGWGGGWGYGGYGGFGGYRGGFGGYRGGGFGRR
ncbi:MAG: hypothetical protein P4L56_05495 [Candidatus Sulfopaludibacter sp.]|nr:hypothetical protein [Candidatus Sulfopaludibacter sp.]